MKQPISFWLYRVTVFHYTVCLYTVVFMRLLDKLSRDISDKMDSILLISSLVVALVSYTHLVLFLKLIFFPVVLFLFYWCIISYWVNGIFILFNWAVESGSKLKSCPRIGFWVQRCDRPDHHLLNPEISTKTYVHPKVMNQSTQI